MKTNALFRTISACATAVCVLALAGTSWGQDDTNPGAHRTFTVIQAEGDVQIIEKPGDGDGAAGEDPTVLGAVEVGKSYPYGTTLRTGRNATAVLQFSPDNTVRMLANTTVTADPTIEDPKTVRVILDVGELDVKLDDFPEDENFEVETPVGICGAVGTEFYVMYVLHADGYTGELIVTTSEGEVVFWGPFVSFEDDTLRPGSTFALAIIQCPQRRYVFFPMIDIMGQDINLNLGGPHFITLEDGSTIQLAMGNVPGAPPYAGVRTMSGRVLVGGAVFTEEDFARFVRGNALVGGLSADDYMNAAEWLCLQCERLALDGIDPLVMENIDMLPTPVGLPASLIYWDTWDDWQVIEDLPDMADDDDDIPSDVTSPGEPEL